MDKISQKDIKEFENCSFDCSCKKVHALDIAKIHIGKNGISAFLEVMEKFQGKKVYFVCDENTYDILGKDAFNSLKEKGFDCFINILKSEEEILIPNEKNLGRVFMGMDLDTGVIVGVGSGTISDMSKYLSAISKIPYIMLATAPSMDGYVSNSSSMTMCDIKSTFPSTLPYAVICDIDILKNAPIHLIRAGFGDVIGKYTALIEWRLANLMVGEYLCEEVFQLTNKALIKCIDLKDGLIKKEEKSIKALMEALILTGVAMSFVSSSRPASGSEHAISHYIEMDFVKRKIYPHLHGEKVGMASVYVCKLLDMAGDIIPKECFLKEFTSEEIINALKSVGCYTSPKALDIPKELFYKAIMNGYKVRERYSILKHLLDNQVLEKYAQKVVLDIYE